MALVNIDRILLKKYKLLPYFLIALFSPKHIRFSYIEQFPTFYTILTYSPFFSIAKLYDFPDMITKKKLQFSKILKDEENNEFN